MIETHRSFANTWECDENAHINVQFYFKRFEEALDVFLAKSGLNKQAHSLVTRHVRFHKEVHAANSLSVESGVISHGPYAGCLGHRMINITSGKLCTTALDQLHSPLSSEYLYDAHLYDEVLPRGLESGAIDPVDTAKYLSDHNAMITNYTTIRSHDLDENGDFLSSRIISMFTDGAPHLWERAGVTTPWLQENNFGRVAVEIKINPVAKPVLGVPLQLVSRVSEIEGRTFRINHQIEEIQSRRLIALGQVRCLVMSLDTRKAVSLPTGMTMKC